MPLSDTPYVSYVCERDIDFVLLEEFHSEPDFVRWFAAKVTGQAPEEINLLDGPWHSVCDSTLGESDLVLLVRVRDHKHAILIENKVDATAQPDQAMRYVKRGEQGTVQGEWESFTTCIVAPSSYLETDPEASIYDARITYESIHEWIGSHLPAVKRTEWKLRLLREAIEPSPRSSQKKFDERVTTFIREYWHFA